MKTLLSLIRYPVCLMLLLYGTQANAQIPFSKPDTLKLSLQETEKRFLDSNFLLLAAHYNVDANKALIDQAKVWDNPVLVTDQNVYSNNRFFEHGKDANGDVKGQYFIQVQQLIKTAGKRGKLINLATTNARLSELQLSDVLRNLRYQLRQDYFTLVQQLQTKALAEKELQQITNLLQAQEAQWKAGNIAEKDYLRIQAELIGLQQDLTVLQQAIADTQNDLKTLLQFKDNRFIYPIDVFNNNLSTVSLQQLVDSAKQHNPYYQLQQAQTVYQQQNLSYQKALRTPDITVGPEYDHNSNYTPHYWGLSVSLPLPVFNNNKGNIKSATFAIKQQEAIVANAETELQNNVSNAYTKLLLAMQQSSSSQKEFYTKYQGMFNNVLKSYQQKQIGLLEFLDFFDTYKDTQQKLNDQQLNLQLAKEEVNFHAGSDIIKNN